MKDFELLVSLGVFNDSLMNDAVYKFKRYEDASLSYTGINRHEDENRGGWDTVITNEDYNAMLPEEPEESAIPAMKPVTQTMPRMGSTPKSVAQPEPKPATVAQQAAPQPVPAPVQTPAAIDYSVVKVGSKLTHKAFGNGVVTDLGKEYITVAFGDVEKKFLFPVAFKQGVLSK